ncbi:hypothetical protein [Desulfobacula sp.]
MAIKFLFFPFTHMNKSQLKTVLAFFPACHYLSMNRDFKHDPSLQTLFETGKINPIFPLPEPLEKVEQNFGQYLAWARIHKGNKVNLKSLLKDSPYFTDDSDVTAITSQIKGEKSDKEDANADALTKEQSLLQDLLFLKMAHLCDEQNEGIDLALNDLIIGHDTLIASLRGCQSLVSHVKDKKTIARKDLGEMMPGQRIRAWARSLSAMGALEPQGGTPLFITTSEAVFGYLEASCKDLVNALDIHKIKVHENECENKNEWQHLFCTWLMRAVQGDGIRENDMPVVDDRCSLLGQVKLALFSGNGINKIFNCSDKQIPVCLIKLK